MHGGDTCMQMWDIQELPGQSTCSLICIFQIIKKSQFLETS